MNEHSPTDDVLTEMTTRQVGDAVMRVTVIPPEDPQQVRKRDGIMDEGIRPRYTWNLPGDGVFRDLGNVPGRKTPILPASGGHSREY